MDLKTLFYEKSNQIIELVLVLVAQAFVPLGQIDKQLAFISHVANLWKLSLRYP